MIVYLRTDIIQGCSSQVAYHCLVISPSYVWRYTNYQEGTNYLRTYIHRGLVRQSNTGHTLGIL